MMSDYPIRLSVMIAVLTLAAGVLDSLAFTYSASMWKGGRIAWNHASRAAVCFALGITLYWGAVRYLGEAGIVQAEIQTLIWFAVTIIGVVVLGGRFIHWPLVDQIVAVNVFLGLGWLIARTSA